MEYSRWLGWVDQDDPTNIPMGCASLARNVRFDLTSVSTRWGIQTAIQGINQSPITGLLGCAYTPEAAGQSYFQAPILFDYAGFLQIENPVGTGRTTRIQGSLVTLPTQSHMIGTQAYNRAWMAFSDLMTPKSYCSVYDLFTKQLLPYGMKPLGFGWTANTQVLVGECATPSQIENGSTVAVGNGHLYRCTQAGTTGAVQPTWPTTEGATVNDGTAIWQENTPVLANRLPAPNSPLLTHTPGSGAFSAGRDVYIVITFINAQGESIGSIPAKFTNTSVSDQINVPLPALASLAGWIQGLPAQYIPTGIEVYEADVTTGSPAPPGTDYQQVAGGPFALGTTVNINSSAASGIFQPTVNSARITGGMIPTPTTEPVITRSSGAGTFPAGRDVYVLQTYTNKYGETLPGPANSIINTQLDDAVVVDIAGLDGYTLTGVRIYECDVPTGTSFGGSEFPPFSQFALFGSFQPGQTATISNSASGSPPPTQNTTGAAGNIAKDTETGGPNGTQGFRYAVVAFEDQFDTISGIVQAAVIGYDVDENGWELSIFNVPVGPSYIKSRIVGFAAADGTTAGPFYYIPETQTSAGVLQTATVIPDNVTTSATFNFTDEYLIASVDITDRFRVIQPQQCVDIYYCSSVDRIFQTGVPGFYSSHWVSLAADPESYYGDTSLITVGTDDGERAICVREFRGVIYSLRERSGFVISPNTGDPSKWSVTQRWSKVGPCGPRAIDVCGQFMIFVHSSGIYKYEDSYPELVSKELPRWWNTINWQAQQTIWCAIDVEQHEVHFGFPVGGSNVPNVDLTLNYEEGWNNPLLFSRYSGKEITIEQCRKYSVNDISAFLGMRIYRTITGEPNPVEGPVDTDQDIQRQYISQFVYASSSPDGTAQAITPGVYNDNSAGIDSQYEGVSVQQMMSLSKLQGINLNARGNGQLFVDFIAGAHRITDWQPGEQPPKWLVRLRPLLLETVPTKGLTRMAPSRLNERWRPCFSNGAIPDAWFSIKYAQVFVSPMFAARTTQEMNR